MGPVRATCRSSCCAIGRLASAYASDVSSYDLDELVRPAVPQPGNDARGRLRQSDRPAAAARSSPGRMHGLPRSRSRACPRPMGVPGRNRAPASHAGAPRSPPSGAARRRSRPAVAPGHRNTCAFAWIDDDGEADRGHVGRADSASPRRRCRRHCATAFAAPRRSPTQCSTSVNTLASQPTKPRG